VTLAKALKAEIMRRINSGLREVIKRAPDNVRDAWTKRRAER